MLLKRTPPAPSRRIATMLRDERGAAMAAVIGLMATLLLLSVLVVTSVYRSTTFTSYSRAGIQSQASAEAGVAAARAWLMSGNCTPGSTDPAKTTIDNVDFGVDTVFTATIMVKEAGAWIAKCPASAAVPVRIVADGSAASVGAGGLSGANTTRLEATLSAEAVAVDWAGSGAAVFAYDADGFGAGGKMFSVGGTEPDILVKTGDLVCSGNAQGVKHLVVEGGDLYLTGSCNVEGNVWTSGDVKIDGNIRIGLATCPTAAPCGDVVAGGNFTIPSGSPYVYGSAWADGAASLSGNGRVYGQLKAKSLVWNGSHLYSSTKTSYIYGPAEFRAGNPTLNKGIVVQAVSYPASGWAGITPAGIKTKITVTNPITSPTFASDMPSDPIVPNWFDYSFDLADWTGFVTVAIAPNSSAPGYSPTAPYYTFESGYCKAPEINAAVAAAGTSNVVIDARNCPNGIKYGWESSTINQDIAIIANKFDFTGSGKLVSATGTPHKIWLVTEDTNTTQVAGAPAPHCNTATQSFTLGGTFSFGTSTSTANRVMIYTPCRVNLTSGNSVWGQVFAGEVAINGNFSLYYDPLGFPGFDLDTGEELGGGGTELDRELTSIRNIG